MTFEEWYDAHIERDDPDGSRYSETRKAWNAALDNQWQPIETAPKDGSVILTIDATDEEDEAWINYWYEGEWFEDKTPYPFYAHAQASEFCEKVRERERSK